MSPKLLSVNVGQPQTRVEAVDDRPWTSAIFKSPLSGSVWLGATNLSGDGQADLRFHGGHDKAVNVYPSEHFAVWQREGVLPELSAGAFGENFTTLGCVESDVCIGDVLAVGSAIVQVSQPRQPCWKLARRWGVKQLALLVQQSGRTGWYLRVLKEGDVQAGDEFSLVERAHSRWTIAEANRVMHEDKHDLAAARELAECPELSASWRETLLKRIEKRPAAAETDRLDGK